MRRFASTLAAATITSLALVLGACSSSNKGSAVSYTDFNDFERVSQEMADDMMARPWLDKFRQEKGREPVVAIFKIKNKSDDYIEEELLTEQLRETLVNSGKAEFRAEDDARLFGTTVLTDDERRDPGFVQNKMRERGVDFILRGNIVSKRTSATDAGYQFSLQLTEVETSLDRWVRTAPVRLGNQASEKGRYGR
ncbi:MAG: hypothetical protein IT435_09965 [Phycisphaerales bacterium]|nr:hypothetical protein [Phycisphaerales bacterium]